MGAALVSACSHAPRACRGATGWPRATGCAPSPPARCRLNPRLSLAVLRAYGQLTPARLQEMLLHGLLPAPKAAADDAGASQPAEERCAPVDTASHGQQHPLDETVARV